LAIATMARLLPFPYVTASDVSGLLVEPGCFAPGWS